MKQILEGNYDNHVLPFFWQKGESHEKIVEYLDAMKSADIHSCVLESRTHPDFGGTKWYHDLTFIIEEAKKRSMTLWLFDDNHFPTGAVNGLLEKDRPDLRKQVLNFYRYDALGPQTGTSFRIQMLDKTATLYRVVAVSSEGVQDVTSRVEKGRVYVDIPKGRFELYVIFISRDTDTKPYHINMVDKASCDALIETIYEPHYKHFAHEFGKTIVGFFSDEPGFLNEKGDRSDSLIGKEMPLPWSDEVAKRMQTHFGDNFAEVLPFLWHEGLESPRVKTAYMNIITDLYHECFDQRLGDWCRDHGVMHIGHIIEDRDSHARLGPGVGHFFKSMLGQDMAGVDIVLNQLIPGIDEGNHRYIRGDWDGTFFHYALAKLGSSLGRIDPKKQGRTVAEIFGAYGWHEGTKLMKWILDHFLVRGVNHFIPHAFSMDAFPDWDCPPHFYAHGQNPQFPYFKELMIYLNKMSTLLSDGKPNPNVAIVYHGESQWAGQAMWIQEVAKVLTQHQVNFDFIPQDCFASENPYNTNLEQGLQINNHTYTLLIVPEFEFISKDLGEYIEKHPDAVMFINNKPRAYYDSNQSIPAFDTVPVCKLEDLKEHLGDLKPFQISEASPFLRYYEYEKEGDVYHMFFNEDPYEAIDVTLSFKDPKKRYCVDVLNGEVSVFDGHLKLSNYESCVIVEGDLESKVKPVASYKSKTKIPFDFEVRYTHFKTEEALGPFKVTSPVNLTESLFPMKSGVFTYRTQVQFPSDQGILDLGDVYESVTVWIDGKEIGKRFAPPYTLKFEGVDASKPVSLEIRVSNTLNHSEFDFFALTEPIAPSGLMSEIEIHTQ